MTSAYETMTEREQKATTPRCIAEHCAADQELDNSEILMEETSSSRTSLAIDDSSSEESLLGVSSADLRLPDGSFNGDLSIHHKEAQKMTDEHGKSGKDEESFDCSVYLNEADDISRANKETQLGKNKETSFEDNERYDEKKFVTALSADSTALENKSGKGQRNQSVLEVRVQERCDDKHAENNFRNSAEDMRGCCEKVAELRLDETQNEADEGNVDQQDDSFYDAVRSGNVKRVSALIASGCVQNLDEPDWNVSGDPPLLVAATNHCLPMLSTLLANGCDPAVRSPRGETALHRVILNGGPSNVLKFVEDLLEHGCPLNVKEAGGGSTALHVLSRQLAHAPLKFLHHNFDAALKTLELLAKTGSVNAKDHQGRSALHILASSTIFDNNHRITDIESLIGTLLDAGADTALKNDRGETPLHESLECGTLNTAALLILHTPAGITSRYGETPLHIASRKNYADMVAKLLDHGEDPGTQDAGGNTPLHLASARGFHQTVSLLVTSPLAQLENVNIDGLTALQVAAESGFINAVRILLKAGADPSQTVHYCATILRRHPDISLLINHEMTRRRQLAA